MKLDLDIFRMSRGLAAHSAARQELIARNVANADTPGYRAIGLTSFADYFSDAANAFSAKSTRLSHLPSAAHSSQFDRVESLTTTSEKPNGNNVGLEEQMISGIKTQQDHDLAIGVFRKSLGILRLAIGRGR